MQKWDNPKSPMITPLIVGPPNGERGRVHARAFRRWLARGAESGGLRALSDVDPHLPPPEAIQRPRGAGQQRRR